MGQRDRRHVRLLHRVPAGLVVAVLLLAGTAYWFDLGPRWFGFDYPSPVTEPDRVAPPPGLTLPEPVPAAAVARPPAPAAVDRRAVARVLRPLLRDRDLGRDVTVAVAVLPGVAPVYAAGPDRFVPASTLKLLTAAAALERLGEDHRFRTRVVADPGRRTVTLVGGGDPLLARAPARPTEEVYPPRADLLTLARATARALADLGRSTVRVRYDADLFSGPPASPHWEASYLPDQVVTPVSALWVDRGVEPGGRRSADPARRAGQAFARALARSGVEVRGAVRARSAGVADTEIAAVEGAPLAQVVGHVLEVSDNEAAEVLLRHLALAAGRPGSFEEGTRAALATLRGLGVDLTGVRMYDGSGLSRANRLTAAALLDVLALAASPEHPRLRPVLTGLPVAGFTGSLAYRFDTGAPPGQGAVRAKTGTLSGVHGLAGTLTTADGAVLAFVAVADRVRLQDGLDARVAIDRMAAALAACACAS